MVMTTGFKNYSDVHYTKKEVSKDIIEHYKPSGKILEPFKGDGAFLNHLPSSTDWCEIEEGVDFFDYNKEVDWIITNPPFSNLTEVMKHCFSIARNTVLLVPLSKIYSSSPRLKLIKDYAGIVEEYNFGTGRNIGFNIGFPFAAIHFERNYKGATHKTYSKLYK